jgi:formylglycine-generating enzyme required for sulfatase activity
MLSRLLLVSLFVICLGNTANADPFQFVDGATGALMAYAPVYLDNSLYGYTDLYGRITISLTAGTRDCVVVFKGQRFFKPLKVIGSTVLKVERFEDIDLTAEPPKTFTNSIGMSFVLIPAGSFKMGSPDGEDGQYKDERQHLVTISKPFYLQTTEVTQKQWTQVMGSNPSSFKDCGDNCPVESVSWDDSQEFIRELNQKAGWKKYRLPTEAEWEYACRAGSEGRFCFGNQKAELEKYGWYATGPFVMKTHPVGEKKPNAWGLYDMHGNVKEWCQDWYGEYSTGHVTDPTGPKAEKERVSHRVSRGGSWNLDSRHLRSANRSMYKPGYRNYTVGFRVARDP